MAGGNATVLGQTSQADVYAEQSVIGSMLIDDKVVGLVVSELTEHDFVLSSDQALFRAFRQKHLAGEVIDPVTVLALAAPGDQTMRAYVQQLMDITPTAANVAEYIRQTRENSRLRKLRSIGAELSSLTRTEDAIPVLQAGMELLSQEGRDDEADMAKAMAEYMEDFNRTPEYLPWGFTFLDDGLYVERGDFVVLAGRPSDGKTALALHMARQQAKTLNVGFFSLETGRIKLSSRLVAAESGLPLAQLKTRTLKDEEHLLFSDSVSKLSKIAHLSFIQATQWTVEQIEARTLARKFDVIYVDYLQLVASSRPRTDRTNEVSDISMALANLARRHGVAVVALSQLSRPANKTKRRVPVLADLRESGQIEQDADTVMFIWRDSETSSNAKRFLTLAKNKEGKLGDWNLVFRGESQQFIPSLSGGSRQGEQQKEDDDDPF